MNPSRLSWSPASRNIGCFSGRENVGSPPAKTFCNTIRRKRKCAILPRRNRKQHDDRNRDTGSRTEMRQSRVAAYDVVTANSLAAHLGMTNVAPLTAEAVIEQRTDGCYDQAASRLK